MAAVFWVSFRRRAMVWRSRVIFTRSSRGASGRGRRRADGRRRRGRGGRRPASAASASPLVMRPSLPVPVTRDVELGLGHDPLDRGRQRRARDRRGRAAAGGDGRSLGLGLGRSAGAGAGGHAADHLAGRHHRTFRRDDLGQHAVGGGGDLDGHLVGLDLDQHLVLLHRLARLLPGPAGDRALGHELAHDRRLDLDESAAGRRLGAGCGRSGAARAQATSAGALGGRGRSRRCGGAFRDAAQHHARNTVAPSVASDLRQHAVVGRTTSSDTLSVSSSTRTSSLLHGSPPFWSSARWSPRDGFTQRGRHDVGHGYAGSGMSGRALVA